MQLTAQTATRSENDVAAITAVVADDSERFRSAFTDFLASQAVVVVGQSGSGEAAVQQVQRGHPDLAFIDVRMPGIGGMEACRQIRASCPGTKVVLISAAKEVEQDDDSGACAFIAKLDAVRPERLSALIDRLVGRGLSARAHAG